MPSFKSKAVQRYLANAFNVLNHLMTQCIECIDKGLTSPPVPPLDNAKQIELREDYHDIKYMLENIYRENI